MEGSLLRSIVVGTLLWLVVSTVGGFVVLAQLGERGSVIQLLVGALMGFFGAASHVLLSLFPRIRRSNFLWRGLLNWLLAFLVFAFIAVEWFLTDLKSATSNPSFWPELARSFLLYIGAPTFCLALLVALITSRRTAQNEA
jgi:hypothetical protein